MLAPLTGYCPSARPEARRHFGAHRTIDPNNTHGFLQSSGTGSADLSEPSMTECSAKPPTIPVPFHKLLQVVALVDRGSPTT
jgi:hypothetical protein